jgi:hypothetical protein
MGALIGAVPGVLLMIANVVFVTGEALLSVGVGAIFLAVGGAVAGALLGSQRGAAGRTVIGGLIGALPGILAFFVPGLTQLAPLILIAGVVAGGMIAGNQGPPSSPHPKFRPKGPESDPNSGVFGEGGGTQMGWPP